MRFQPSWIVESLFEQNVSSIFFPISVRPHQLLWFKQRGIKLFVNDPVESRALLLRAVVQNGGEHFSDQNRKKFNQVIKTPLEVELNPFRLWLERPFTRQQLDYLFYWREVACEIASPLQRELFWAAVYSILHYWLGFPGNIGSDRFNPDELMAYMLSRQKDLLCDSDSTVEVSNFDLESVVLPKKSDLVVIPLMFDEKNKLELDPEIFFHAWYRGDSDLVAARSEIEAKKNEFIFKWNTIKNVAKLGTKAENSSQAVICWSGAELPPKLHEELIVVPFLGKFNPKFKKSVLKMKTVDHRTDDYDFILAMA